jgi:hypothetical protein
MKIHAANIKNGLREYMTPQENDLKKWIYQMIHNSKDSISLTYLIEN